MKSKIAVLFLIVLLCLTSGCSNTSQIAEQPAPEGIGRAKSVPADRYVEAYAQLVRQMEEQISAVAEKGEEAL